jgi:hypothetical protein
MSPSWYRPSLYVAALAACSGGDGARFPTASELPSGPRRPGGIAVDLVSEPPTSADLAQADDGIVTLRAPLGTDVALATVRRFFEAVIAEDPVRMSEVMRGSTQVQNTRVGAQVRVSDAIAVWRTRFMKQELGELQAHLVYRESEIVVFRGDQLDALPLSVRYLAPTAPPRPTDLVLEVPIATPTVKNERLLGDEIFFWLRRDGDRYVIYRMAEELPF